MIVTDDVLRAEREETDENSNANLYTCVTPGLTVKEVTFRFYHQSKALAKARVLAHVRKHGGSVPAATREIVRSTGLEKQVRNLVAWEVENKPEKPANNPGNNPGNRARQAAELEGDRWRESVNEEMRMAAREAGQPIAQRRVAEPNPEGGEGRKARHIFDAEDLLDAVARAGAEGNCSGEVMGAARGGGEKGGGGELGMVGMVRVRLPTPSLTSLRKTFAALHPSNRQYGLDETLVGPAGKQFIAHRHELGEKVVAEAFVPVARQYAKLGLPPALRPAIYRIALGLPPTPSSKEAAHYASLLRSYARTSFHPTDSLLALDVGHVSCDASFFPFADALKSVVEAFSRDPYPLHNAVAVAHDPIQVLVEGDTQATNVPASGVHPFKGFIRYAAPLSLVYEKQPDLYFAFRALYSRLFCRLTVIDSTPGNLVHLCLTFERLLFAQHPSLALHLSAVGAKPLQVAFPWICHAFVGALPVEEVLLLWDRCVGHDSLVPLAVCAAALFLWRSEVLLCCKDKAEVEGVFGSGQLHRIRIVPLLQSFLFLEEFKG
ncbi:hypothetical protein TeGR_g2873 [Tetraparma gracilis]|uniref:Rab-GAP TBC domain-containing protein n=1 Tax=Tetraparma gracilis TaxID=2962635 RepID=A0ABQ6MFP0_9STRA|nr:hypothetical protein TeGR_g2873 [Tetraparma gracilis]